MSRNVLMSVLSVLSMLMVVTASAAQPVSPPISQAVAVRVVQGEYRSEGVAGGERRGSEYFQLVVNSDGSRTLSISSDLTWRNSWFTVVLRSAADFRPLEAYVNYWSGGRYKGSGHFVVEGERMLAESNGPDSGRQQQETAIPEHFSIGTHPVSADGWHTAALEASNRATSKNTRQLQLYSVEASADSAKPVLGTLVPLEVEYLGEETIEVPAGRFATQRYRLAGMNDLWVYGADRIVIRSELPRRGLRYVLTSMSAR